jgi:hypothetical protein
MSLLAWILDSIHEFRFLPKVLLVGAGVLIMGTDALAAIEEKANQSETERIATIERRMGGQIGIALFDSASGRRFEYQGTYWSKKVETLANKSGKKGFTSPGRVATIHAIGPSMNPYNIGGNSLYCFRCKEFQGSYAASAPSSQKFESTAHRKPAGRSLFRGIADLDAAALTLKDILTLGSLLERIGIPTVCA